MTRTTALSPGGSAVAGGSGSPGVGASSPSLLSAAASGAPADSAAKQPPHNAWKGFLVAAAYATASASLALTNKALLSRYEFSCVFSLLSLQLGISLLFCVVTRDWLGDPFSVGRPDADTLRASVPLGVLYVGNVAAGLAGLKLVNVPLFFAIRRLTPLVIMGLEYALYRKVADATTHAAVAISVAGTLIAAWDTLSSDWVGYAITLANNAVTAGLYVAQRRFSSGRPPGTMTAFGIVYLNSVVRVRWVVRRLVGGQGAGNGCCTDYSLRRPSHRPHSLSPSHRPSVPQVALPLSAALAVATGELPALAAFPYLGDARFLGSLLLASSMGLALTYTSVLSTTYNSPLATSVTGNVKDLATTLLGAMWFTGFTATAANVGGIALNFCGAALYSAASLHKANAASNAAAAAATAAAAAAAKTSPPAGDGPATSDGTSTAVLTPGAELTNRRGGGSHAAAGAGASAPSDDGGDGAGGRADDEAADGERAPLVKR